MGSGKPERHSKTKEKKGLSLRNPSKKINFKKKTGINKKTDQSKNEENQNKSEASTPASASQQLSFFISEFQSANGVQLSSIELESIKGISFLFFSFRFLLFVFVWILIHWWCRDLLCWVISSIGSRCYGLREPHEGGFWPILETSSLWREVGGRHYWSRESCCSYYFYICLEISRTSKVRCFFFLFSLIRYDLNLANWC